MYPYQQMRQYQQQAIASATPEQLILKLYDAGIAACHREDRSKLRAILTELIASLNFEQGGEIAQRLFSLYEYCLNESVLGDLQVISELLTGLRDAWRSLAARQAA